jgi:hypothetical protein
MLRKLIFLVLVSGWALTHTVSADLVGFWGFEDADGGVIKDSSGNGYNGMIEGGAEVVADSVRGQVLRNVAGGSVDLFIPVHGKYFIKGQKSLALLWVV